MKKKIVSNEYFSNFSADSYLNSGIANTGKENTGLANSGNWNSGNWNSGYRNSGAFCLNNNPKIFLFDKETNILVRDWEGSRPYQLMNNLLNFTFWIYPSEMSEKEKQDNPKYETTEGYLKTISYKEGWDNMWGNLSDKDKSEFTSLPNFDSSIFESITGIKI